MKHTIYMMCVLCIIGCATTKKAIDESAPLLLLQYPLPPVPESIPLSSFNLEMMLFIKTDGNVEEVQLIKGSGDNDWDSLATASVKKWLFRPAKMNNQPVSTWFRLKTNIRLANPQIMSLKEILCQTVDEADSVYAALRRGEDFGELAKKYSVAPLCDSEGLIREVDINMYPTHIRDILKNLSANEYTKPIKYGDLFVIFKRVK